MNEQFKHNVSPVPPQAQADVLALVKKIQEHLVILEKKIDNLLNKPQERPFQGRPFQEKHFSKPFRSFGHSHRHGKGEHDHNPREGGFPQGRHFKKHQSDGNRGFGQKQKPFFHKQKDRE